MDSETLAALYANDTPSGIWSWFSYDPDEANKAIYPGLRGVPMVMYWENIELTKGVFDWSEMDTLIETAVDAGLYFFLTVWVGPHAPDWIYDTVPEVLTDDSTWTFPYYFDEDYL